MLFDAREMTEVDNAQYSVGVQIQAETYFLLLIWWSFQSTLKIV